MKIQDQEWYKETAHELRQYKKYKGRIGVLEARMLRLTGPSSRVTASYGEAGATKPDTDEDELEQLKVRVASIDYALQALTEIERRIIKLKYFERRRDIFIYEMDIPMSPTTYYKALNNAMITVKKILSGEKMESFWRV